MTKILVHEIDSFCKVNCSRNKSAMIAVDKKSFNVIYLVRHFPPSKIILTSWTFFSFWHYRRPDNFAAQQMWLWDGSLRLVLCGHWVEMGEVTCPRMWSFQKYLPSYQNLASYLQNAVGIKIFIIFALSKISLLNICLHIKIFASLSKYFRAGRKRADEMGSELGPEHDHDMDRTSISQKVIMSRTVCLFCCQSTLMITT